MSKVQVGKAWLDQSGIDPAACVMIGDTQHDAEVAKALGTKCVLYTGGHQSRARLEAVCPNVIDDLAQLPRLLENYKVKSKSRLLCRRLLLFTPLPARIYRKFMQKAAKISL